MGYRVILCVPENFSIEKREVMKALGGEVVLTPKDDGMKGAIAKAEELPKTIPNSYVPQQFANPYNTESHYETTGARDLGADGRAASTRGSPARAPAARSPASRSI